MESLLYIQFMNIRGNTTDMSKRDRAAWGPYWKAALAFTIIYPATLVLAIWFVPEEAPTLSDRLVMLIPFGPLLGFGVAYIRFLAKMDEYGQLIHYKGLAAGFGAAMMAAAALGFVGLPGDATLFNQLVPWMILAIGMATWIIALGAQVVRDA